MNKQKHKPYQKYDLKNADIIRYKNTEKLSFVFWLKQKSEKCIADAIFSSPLAI